MQKLSAALLAAIVAANTLLSIGCGQEGDSDETTSPSGSDNTQTTSESGEQLGIPDDAAFNGYTFRILSRPEAYVEEVYAESETGDVLSDSVWRRNQIVKELLDIEFEILESSGSFEYDAREVIMAGDDAYDAIPTHGRAAFHYPVTGAAVDWYDLPYVDLEKSWWSQDAAENFTINGKLYAMCGDISYATIQSSMAMYFNKDLFDEYQLEYPYEMVRNGTWTFDEFNTLARTFGSDLNGDSEMQLADDQFGYATGEWAGPIEAVYSTGSRIITVNNDGYPELTFNNEAVVGLYDAYFALLNSESGYVKPADYTYLEAFCDGRVAFADDTLAKLADETFRNSEVNFGVIPWPKWSEELDRYYSNVDAGHSLWVIPITNPDLERTSIILEAMAYYGQQEIIPAYYDICLENKFLRDESSVEMLDFIYGGAVFDLGYYNDAQFGGKFASTGYYLVNDPTLTFTTFYAQNEQAVKTLIDESMESYLS